MTKLAAIHDHRAEVEEYRRLLERNPTSLRFAEFADRLRREGRISDATAICARGLAHHPHYATGHVIMGEIFRDAGLLETAEREWREALRFDPGLPRAHLRLGELYLSKGETEYAVQAFKAALLHNPEFPEAQARLAELLGDSDREEQGREEDARGLDRWQPGRRPAWLRSGRFEELVQAVGNCRSVESAALVNSDGLLVAGTIPASGEPEAGAGMAAELVVGMRDLMARLAAGRLRAVLVRGKKGNLRCVALGDLTLVAALRPELPVGAAEAEIEEAVLDVHRRGRSKWLATE